MEQKPSIFTGMTLFDWLLAAGFTVVIALLAKTLFPPNGWIPGIVVAIGFLYMAKRKRDSRLKNLEDKKD